MPDVFERRGGGPDRGGEPPAGVRLVPAAVARLSLNERLARVAPVSPSVNSGQPDAAPPTPRPGVPDVPPRPSSVRGVGAFMGEVGWKAVRAVGGVVGVSWGKPATRSLPDPRPGTRLPATRLPSPPLPTRSPLSAVRLAGTPTTMPAQRLPAVTGLGVGDGPASPTPAKSSLTRSDMPGVVPPVRRMPLRLPTPVSPGAVAPRGAGETLPTATVRTVPLPSPRQGSRASPPSQPTPTPVPHAPNTRPAVRLTRVSDT